MADLKDILVPDIGDDEVEVIELCVEIGEEVEAEASIVTVESDKASMDIPAPFAGKVAALSVEIGDKIKEGDLLAKLEISLIDTAPNNSESPLLSSSESEPAVSNAPVSKPEEATSATTEVKTIEVLVPDIGDSADVDVIDVLVIEGDSVEAEDGLITLETDKATMDVPSPEAGEVVSLKVKEGDKVSEGSLVLTLKVVGAEEPASKPDTVATTAQTTPAPAPAPAPTQLEAPAKPAPVPHHPSFGEKAKSGKVHASPSVRRLAREFGVDLTQVNGTGAKSRILKEDVQSYVKYELSRPKLTPGASVGSGSGGLQVLAPPKVDFSKFGETEEIALTRIQKISGPNLHRNWVTIPHVTQFEEADITDLEAFRKEQNTLLAKRNAGLKITPLVFMMKAVADALKAYPVFNTSLSESGESLIQKKYFHIGIAVDTPGGLVVPVVRDVDQKGIKALSEELAEISLKAREGKLKAADMQGSCFTISSLGGIGGTAFTPIVNAPDVAILGVSKSEMKPKWNGSEFEPRLMLPLSLSYDHRVIDGAVAARFAVHLSSVLGDIRQLIM